MSDTTQKTLIGGDFLITETPAQDIFTLEELSEEQKMMRDSAKEFIDREVVPHHERFESKDYALTEATMRQLGEMGFLGVTVPEQYGGLGMGFVTTMLACDYLSGGNGSLATAYGAHTGIGTLPILLYGTEEQKNKYLPDLATGTKFGAYCLTEPDAGSDPSSMKTRAKKVAGGWQLSGSKMWITNATIADLAIIWAKDEHDQVKGFIVEKTFAGFNTNEIHHKLSLRASITGEIVLEDCFVPDANYLPGTEKGLACALGCLTKARYGIAWGAIGAAMACYEAALNYAKERLQFGKPIAAFQLIQVDLADMFTEIVRAQTLNLQLGRLQEQNRANYVMVSVAKMNACKEALKIARKARNILGANGISLEYPVMRHMVNLEAVYTYEGTDNMHHLIIGKHITGLDAFS